MISSRSWHILQWAIFALILASLFFIVGRYTNGFTTINWRPSHLIPFLLVSLFCILVRAILSGQVAVYFDVNLRFEEMLGLTIVSSTLNETLPASLGTLIKPAYFSQVHQLSVGPNVTMIIIISLMVTCASSALALIGLVWAGLLDSVLSVVFVTLFVVTLAVLFCYPKGIPKNLAGTRLARALILWQGVCAKRELSYRALALSTALCLLDALRFWLAFLLIGVDLTLDAALILTGVALLIAYFSLVPGALGLIEGAVAGISVLLGYPAMEAVVATLVFRAGILIFAVPATPLYYFRLTREIQRATGTKLEDPMRLSKDPRNSQ